jgi:hypothetical protein
LKCLVETAAGNRLYHAEVGLTELPFAQITNEDLREGLCLRDHPSIVRAICHEIGAALKWGFDVADESSIPRFTGAHEIAAREGTWRMLPATVDGKAVVSVKRLFQNRPNLFNPPTEIRSSLAQTGKVEVAVYDLNGRPVKTLVNGKKEAGLHSVVWGGTSDAGMKVGSGICWSKMKTAACFFPARWF